MTQKEGVDDMPIWQNHEKRITTLLLKILKIKNIRAGLDAFLTKEKDRVSDLCYQHLPTHYF